MKLVQYKERLSSILDIDGQEISSCIAEYTQKHFHCL